MRNKILAVDDEPDILEILKTRLEPHGYQVYTVGNGQEGIRQAKALNPDLIILDVAMPGMDGFEVLAHLRGCRETVAVPVIMLTSHGKTDNILEAEQLMASDYLIKPFDFKDLLAAVRKNIRK